MPLRCSVPVSLRVRLLPALLIALALLIVAPGGAHAQSYYNVEICGNNAAPGQMGVWSGFHGSGAALGECNITTPNSGTEGAGYDATSVYTAPANEAITYLSWSGAHFWSAYFGAYGWSSGLAANISGNNGAYNAAVQDCSSNSNHQYNWNGANALNTSCNNNGLSGGWGMWAGNVGLIEVCNASSCADRGDSGIQIGALSVQLYDPWTTPSIGVGGSLWSAANGGWVSGLQQGANLSMSYWASDPGTVCTLYAYLVNSSGQGVWGSNSNPTVGWDGSAFTSGQPCSPNPSGALTPNLAQLATGTYYLNAVAQNPGDYAGGSYGWAQGATWTQGAQINVDNSPPTGSLTPSGNSTAWYGSAQTVVVDAADVGSGLSHVSCSGPGAPATIAPSQLPYTINVSQNGTDTISCTAVDNTGNTASLGSATMHVDQQNGSVAFSGTSQNTWYASAQTVTVTASEPTTYSGIADVDCSVNGGSYTQSAGASATVPVSADGVNTVSCYAVTGAGLSSTPSTYRVLIDKTTPTVSFDGVAGAPAWTHGTAILNVSAADAVSADSVTYLACTVNGTNLRSSDGSSFAITITAQGASDVSCYAENAAGTTSTQTDDIIQIDNTVPTIALAGSSGSTMWVSGTQTVTTNAAEAGPSGVASTSCELGHGGGWTTQPGSSQAFPVTASGQDTITCYATTNAGVQSTYATYNLKVDNQQPTVAFTGAPQAPQWTSDQATITATGSEAQALSGIKSVTCQVGSAAPVTTNGSTASPQLTTATQGATPIACYATSNTGVQGPTVTQTYNNDSNLATVTFTGPAQDAWENASQTISAAASETPNVSGVKSVTCQQDGGTRQTVTGPSASIPVSGQGTHTVTCFATTNADAIGDAQTYHVNIDPQTPTATITGPASWASGTQTLKVAAGEATALSGIASIACSVDGGATQLTHGSSASVPVSGDGTHTVTCTSTTTAGTQSAAAVKTVQIDSAAPTVTFSHGPHQSAWYQAAQSIDVTASKSASAGAAIASIDCTIAGQTTHYANNGSGGEESQAVTVPAPGGQLSCTAADTAGNTSQPATWTFNIDATAPAGYIESAAASPSGAVAAHLTDGGSGMASVVMEIQSGASGWQQLPTTWNAGADEATADLPASLAPGTYAVQAVATDKAGNAATVTAGQDGAAASLAIAPPTPPTTLTLALAPSGSSNVTSAVAHTTCKVSYAARVTKAAKRTKHKKTAPKSVCKTVTPAYPNPLALTLPYGQSATLVGTLTSGGQPVVAQPLTISQLVAGQSTPTVIGHAFTSATGGYVFALVAGPTRQIIVSYAGSPKTLPASSTGRVAVSGSAKLAVARRLKRGRLALKVTLAGGNVPARGVAVQLAYRTAKKGRWSHLRVRARTNHAGVLNVAVKLPAKALRSRYLQMQATVASQPGWPYLAASADSPALRLTAVRSPRH